MLAAADSSLFLQVLGAVVGGVLVAAVVALAHRGRRVLIKAEGVIETIAKFGEQWTAATLLAETIKATTADVAALKTQLGTTVRNPEWPEMEAYLHEWRHEHNNQMASLNITIGLLEKLANQMSGVADQMTTLTQDVRQR